MSDRAVLLMESLEEPENANLRLTDVGHWTLEEAGVPADEGSLVSTFALMRIIVLGPKNFGAEAPFAVELQEGDRLWGFYEARS